MATWYVRPDSAHNTVRDGTTYGTAWGSFTEVVWSSLLQGDTLYVCGAHYPIATSVNIGGTSTGGSLTNLLTLLGNYPNDPGSITLPNGGNYTFTIPRNYVKVSNLTINANTTAAAVYLDKSGITIENCHITAQASAGISIEAGNGAISNDITIRGNTFSGTCGTATGAMVRWRVTTTAAVATLNRLSLINNTFINCQVPRSAVTVWVEPTAGNCVLTDVIATGNRFENVSGTCLEISGKEVYNYAQGIKVLDNTFLNCTENVLNTGGGCISVIGWGQSTTTGFGINVISGNRANSVRGAAGLINVFYGTYLIEDNYCDGLDTSTIDACGVLIDRGNKYCTVRRNTIKNLYGVLGNPLSLSGGTGILILNDNIGHRVYSNTVENSTFAVGLGDAGIGQSDLVIFNNTFSVRGFGIYFHASSNPASLTFKNNFISGTGYKVYKNAVAAWLLEDYNAWQGMTSGNLNHTLGANDVIATDLPFLDTDLKKSGVLVHTGSFVSTQVDAKKVAYFNPPSIGAFEFIPERATAPTRGVR